MTKGAELTSPSRRHSFAERMNRLINDSPMTQQEIAEALGYPNQNIITMFKKGSTRVPLEKVIPLATLLGEDPAEMLREWFDVYMPGTLAQMELYMGNVLTAHEASWVRNLRKALGKVPAFDGRWSEPIKMIARGR